MSPNDPRKPNDSTPTVPIPPLAEAADSGMDLGGAQPQSGTGSDPELALGGRPQEIGSAVDLGAFRPPVAGSGDIPLADLANPPSGQSLTSWTEVIRRQREALESGADSGRTPVRVDSPSDKDLLAKLAEVPARGEAPSSAMFGKKGDTSEIPEGELPVYPPPPEAGAVERPSASDIDLGRLWPSPGSSQVEGSEVGFDILYPPSDAGGAMPLPPAIDLPPLTASEFDRVMTRPPAPFGDEDSIPFATELGPGASAVPIGEAVAVTPLETGRSSILDVLIADASGPASDAPPPTSDILDYGDKPAPFKSYMPTPTEGSPGSRPGSQPAIDLPARGTPYTGTGSGADWPPPPEDPLDLSGPASGVGSDDAVDLYAEVNAPPPSITDSGSLEISDRAIEEAQRKSQYMESSSVDLSSRPSFSGSEFDIALSNQSDVAPAPGSDAELDLSVPQTTNDGSSSMVFRQQPLQTNQAALAAEFEARRRDRTDEEPVVTEAGPPRPARRLPGERRGDSTGRGREYLLRGTALGLLLGAGAVLAAYFAGALPSKGSASTGSTAVAGDNTAEIDRLRKDADAAQAEARESRNNAERFRETIRRSLSEAGVTNPDRVDEAIKVLAESKSKSDATIRDLTNAANEARGTAAAARNEATTAKNNLAAAEKTATDARTELTGLTKALKDFGIDPAKPTDGVKRLAAAVTAAEAKEKAATEKLVDATKRAEEAATAAELAKKAADDAQKSAAEAVKARDASDTALKAVGDRLAKAKFIGDKADPAAVVKGVDDAIKAAGTEATASLRDELAKARADEAKLKTDLAAAKDKEATAVKAADAAKADADKLAADVKAAGERLTTETAKLRNENAQLARDLEAFRELAAAIKNPGGPGIGPIPKPEPGKLAERVFNDGLRAFHNSRYAEAESNFRKAISFSPDDARYHYLLGLALWLKNDTKEAEAEFEKGRDLESIGRPSSRLISAQLERIQGPARQAVNAYRP
ncbi:MAG TPA: hypothetical protein VKD90_22285 [Gemmataceae bacterium]|nr:hypothetical protein [Gemmataceae bacterium]